MKTSHHLWAVGGFFLLVLTSVLLQYDISSRRLQTTQVVCLWSSKEAALNNRYQLELANVTRKSLKETTPSFKEDEGEATRTSTRRPSVTHRHTNLFLFEDDYVRDCITAFIVRRKFKRNTREFVMPNNLKGIENSTQRRVSFELIYEKHLWGPGRGPADPGLKGVQGSGTGSSLDWAQEAIATLHSVIIELKSFLKKEVIKILDIPCGDFVWMYRFLQTRNDVNYTGMDIVSSLIENHKKVVGRSPNIFFAVHDIASSPLEEAYDLVLCRMMLQHLAEPDVFRVLHHINASGSRFLLATTHPTAGTAISLKLDGGRFRYLNLEVPPVQMAPPLCMSRDGPPDRGWDHFLALWSLPLRQVTWCNKTGISYPERSRRPFVTCG